jgi:cell division protein FtsI/penicillin-binding protein 2
MRNRGNIRSKGKLLARGKVIRQKPYTVSSVLLMNQKPRRTRKRIPARTLWAFFAVLAVLCAFLLFRRGAEPPAASLGEGKPAPKAGEAWRPEPDLLAEALAELDGVSCLELNDGPCPRCTLQTSFDREYQQQVQERLGRSMALGGVAAALDPRTGRILALASYNEVPERPVAFFWKAYPSASLFKIVTAAAAIETGCLEPDSVIDYTGRDHTLYRKDLRQETYSWSNRITLEKAFAKSVNPVFGKIGIHTLGRLTLQEYGSAFFFGLALPGEVPFETSRLQVPEHDLGIAEIASGFNRRTLVTPLHAAWMSALIASDGAAPVPWLVESVRAEGGEEVYRHREEIPVRVLKPKTARDMRTLMEATIRVGTCQKSFRGRSRDSRLRSVVFGGKTGNINNKNDTIKYDWFTGYAMRESGEAPLALSVVVIHGPLLGHRANRIAYDLFRDYFRLNRE